MTAASRLRGPTAALVVALGLLAGCTGSPAAETPRSTPGSTGTPIVAPSPRTATARPPLPTSPSPSVLSSDAPVQLSPVSSSPADLGRIDIRDGSPSKKQVPVRLPAASGYTVTVGCIGRPGTLLRWSVIGTSDAYPGFLFGSTTPCNGSFVTDAAMANIKTAVSARLEVSLDPGVRAATIVLRPAPADAHL